MFVAGWARVPGWRRLRISLRLEHASVVAKGKILVGFFVIVAKIDSVWKTGTYRVSESVKRFTNIETAKLHDAMGYAFIKSPESQ